MWLAVAASEGDAGASRSEAWQEEGVTHSDRPKLRSVSCCMPDGRSIISTQPFPIEAAPVFKVGNLLSSLLPADCCCWVAAAATPAVLMVTCLLNHTLLMYNVYKQRSGFLYGCTAPIAQLRGQLGR
jgi:hypothetical protein